LKELQQLLQGPLSKQCSHNDCSYPSVTAQRVHNKCSNEEESFVVMACQMDEMLRAALTDTLTNTL
jgi:hypothetical protein